MENEFIFAHQSKIGYAYHPVARIASGLAKGVQLLQIVDGNACLLFQLPLYGRIERLCILHQASRKRLHALKRLFLSPDQQHA